MEGKRGSECLLKSVSNIDFNPLSSMFTCENNATDDTLESLKMKTFSDIRIYMNNSTEKNEKEMMKDLLVHFKVCLDMIKQK